MRVMEVSFSGRESVTVEGLYRYDYGQKLQFADVDIPDGAEVDFYQGERDAIRYVENNKVSIPDRLVSQAVTIKAYIFVREEEYGETKKEIVLPVINRQRPGNSIDPEDYRDYRRLLPDGGKTGQILVKSSYDDYHSEWKDPEKVLSDVADKAVNSILNENIITDEQIESLFKD